LAAGRFTDARKVLLPVTLERFRLELLSRGVVTDRTLSNSHANVA
jgi:hypothetical protein